MLCRWIEKDGGEAERSGFLNETGYSAVVLKGLCEKQILKAVGVQFFGTPAYWLVLLIPLYFS